MSLVISIKTPVEQAGMLSIVMGITIASVLEKAGVSDIKLKWPNDVLVNGKKIAGVLIETVKSEPDRTVVIIGIGLNYKWPSEALARPDQPWTDYVSCISNEALPAGRNEIAALLLKSCIESCTRYPEDHQSLLARYSDYDMCFHKDVDVIINNDLKYRGVAQGITDRGAIRVLIDGEERIFHSAQVSLRQTHVGDVKAC